MNSFDWDLRVEQDLALAAEVAAVKENSDAGEEPTTLADTPYAESVRLGHDMYAIPGDYTIQVKVGENSADAELKIEAPEDYEPRVKETYKIRGKKN